MSGAPKKNGRSICLQIKHPWLVLYQDEDGSWRVERAANGYNARKRAAALTGQPEEVESIGMNASVQFLQSWLDAHISSNIRADSLKKNRKG